MKKLKPIYILCEDVGHICSSPEYIPIYYTNHEDVAQHWKTRHTFNEVFEVQELTHEQIANYLRED